MFALSDFRGGDGGGGVKEPWGARCWCGGFFFWGGEGFFLRFGGGGRFYRCGGWGGTTATQDHAANSEAEDQGHDGQEDAEDVVIDGEVADAHLSHLSQLEALS